MSFDSSLSGLNAASKNLSVTGNNIANAGTTGFKSARAEFTDVYAASSLGVSSTSAGTGVNVAAVTQSFTNGDITSTGRALDLAIKGTGFFVLNDQGSTVYSTNGAFTTDKSGYIVDSSLARLNGYLTDSSNNISGAIGDLKVTTANIPPSATANITIGVNINSAEKVKSTPFVAGFTAANPPNATTYNQQAQSTVYDSLGNSHLMTTYFVKAPAPNTWRVYIGIDGNDVTPPSSDVPDPTYPQAFANTAIAQPYTMVFSPEGIYIPHNAASPTTYFGPGPVLGADGTLVTSGTLTPFANGQFSLNGTGITAPTAQMDTVSTTDNLASAIAIREAVNASSAQHGVTAIANPNNVSLGAYTPSNNAVVLTNGMLTINGTQIDGNLPATNQLQALVNLINTKRPNTNVSAELDSNNGLVLTAADGRNIQLQTNGIAGGPSFANFALSGGANLNQVKHGTVTLTTTPKVNTTTLTQYSGNTTTALTGANLTINGTAITGTPTGVASLIGLINAQSQYTKVTAIQSGDDIVLQASGGQDIVVASDGNVTAGGPNFASFAMVGAGTVAQLNQPGNVALKQQDNYPITVAGTNPLLAGFPSGELCGTVQTSSDPIVISNFNPGTGALSPQTITLDLSSSTMFSNAFVVNSLVQDGYASGGVSGISVDDTGIIQAQYTNGKSQNLGRVALASFPSTNNLQPIGDTKWTATYASGDALIGTPATASLGLILSGSLEDSNVDLTSELVNLIVAQRNFQANAQTIKTEDAVTQTIINIR